MKNPKINFNLRLKDKNNFYSIILRTNFRSERYEYNTKIKILELDWDKNKQQSKSNFEINKTLIELKQKANDILIDGVFSQAHFTDLMSGGEKKVTKDFFGIIDDFCQNASKRLNSSGEFVTYHSVNKYIYTARRLREFQEQKRIKLTFENFNEALFIDFKAFCLTSKSQNTASRYVGCLRAFFRYAKKKYNVEVNDDYKEFKLGKVNVENVVLNDDEIKLIYSYNSDNSKLMNVRRLFLWGCLTGLRFSDYTSLSSENIDFDKMILTKVQQKTGNRVTIPIHPLLKNLIDNEELPHAISNQKFNSYIKELCKECGINQQIDIKRCRCGKRIVLQVPKYEMITSHTARRSFCTNLYKKGVPAKAIMYFSGHRSFREFEKYVVIDDVEKINLVKSVW